MSKTEIFLNEFVGIPGLKVDIVTPTSFIVRDESCNSKNNPLKEIKVTVSDLDVTFEAFKKNAFGSSLYTIGVFAKFEGYEQYNLLTSFTTDLLKYINVESKEDKNYSPSIAWLNVSVRLGLVTVFDKEIKTTYSFKQGNDIVSFYLELPAAELFAKIEHTEKLNNDNIALTSQLISMTRIAEDIQEYKNILLTLSEAGPIVIEKTKALSFSEIKLLNSLNEKHGVEAVLCESIPAKDGVKASSDTPKKLSSSEEFSKLMKAVEESVTTETTNFTPILEVPAKEPKAFDKFVELVSEVDKEYGVTNGK